MLLNALFFFLNIADSEDYTIFEVNAMSRQRISVTVQHPYLDTIVVTELDLRNIIDIRCNIYSLNTDFTELSLKMSKVIQVCASIPILLRELTKSWDRERKFGSQYALENENFNLQLGPNDPGGKRITLYGDVNDPKKGEHDKEYNEKSNEFTAVGSASCVDSNNLHDVQTNQLDVVMTNENTSRSRNEVEVERGSKSCSQNVITNETGKLILTFDIRRVLVISYFKINSKFRNNCLIWT